MSVASRFETMRLVVSRRQFMGETLGRFGELGDGKRDLVHGRQTLKEPTKFFNAKLHQGTVWHGIAWPTPKKKVDARRFVDAYASLKLETDRLKKHDEELDFLSVELQSRRVALGPLGGLPIALYGGLSSFGRSYIRPLVGLFVLWAVWGYLVVFRRKHLCGSAGAKRREHVECLRLSHCAPSKCTARLKPSAS